MIWLRQWGFLIVFLGVIVGLDAQAQRVEMGADHIPRAESAQPGSPHQTAEHTNHPEQAQNPVSLNGGHKTPTHQTREELIRQADSLATLWQIQRAETEQRAAANVTGPAGNVSGTADRNEPIGTPGSSNSHVTRILVPAKPY